MITIQVKDPYTSVYRSGLRVTYGKPLEVSPEDPRVMFWLENGKAEISDIPPPPKTTNNKIRGGIVAVPEKSKKGKRE